MFYCFWYDAVPCVEINGFVLSTISWMPCHSQEVLRNTNVMGFLLPLLKAGPTSPSTIHALRVIQGVCSAHYMNQNTARSAGLLDETMRLLKLGRGWNEIVGAAAGAIASLCNGGNQANIRAFRYSMALHCICFSIYLQNHNRLPVTHLGFVN